MQEFICPNGRMSVNGVCPIFEGDDGQVKDFQTPKEKSFFKFDFEKPTENAFEKADNIISKNIGAYNSFVQEKLGIPSKAQNFLRVGSAIATGSLMPFAIPFLGGMALNNSENNRIQNITMQDTQGDIQTTPARIMNIQPTAQDIARGQGGGIGSSYGGSASPGSQGPGGSDEMGSF